MRELTYSVPDLSCEHCRSVVTSALQPVSGVLDVDVNLAEKRVVVRGEALDDTALRTAMGSAGYKAK